MNTKQDVIERFCALASEVGGEVFHYSYASDCFCGKNKPMPDGFHFDDAVLEWIEEAVRARIDSIKSMEEVDK